VRETTDEGQCRGLVGSWRTTDPEFRSKDRSVGPAQLAVTSAALLSLYARCVGRTSSKNETGPIPTKASRWD
jgi:hypothetical protein